MSVVITSPTCPRRTNEASAGKPLKKAIALSPTPQSAQRQINFGTSRDVKYVKHVTLTTESALPSSVTPQQISYEANLTRTGDTLETAEFPDPTFSLPTFSPDRRSLSFTICLDAAGVHAGKYVGLITVSGPAGLGAGSINLTINTKGDKAFFYGWSIALLIGAFLLLLIKDAAAAKAKNSAIVGYDWWDALKVPVRDLLWWTVTVIALGAAFGALYGAYSADPAWGAAGFAAIVPLVGTAFSAIGGHAILTAFGKNP